MTCSSAAELTPDVGGDYHRCMTRFVITLGGIFVAATVVGACGPGQFGEDEDFTAEVERICADYCEINLACREPPFFESYEECEHNCLHSAYIYNDTECGRATRGEIECVGSQPTCELYNDTLNIHADKYTCQAEHERRVDVMKACQDSEEDPYPKGEP